MSGVAVGIDLGTTFSCVSVYRQGKGAEIISNEYGERIIPSVVYFDPTNGNVLVGKNAVDEIPDCLSNGLYDAKRIMGRKFNDEYISRYTCTKGIPFSIVSATDNQAAFQVQISGRSVVKTPEEVSAEILKYIKKISSEYVGEKVTEAVISVPAYFSNAQRNATRKAADLAELKVLKLITEPTAAAILYVSDKKKDNTNILVFDFGGGTLDVSIIKVEKKQFTVKAVYGDTFLGGRDIDEDLFKHFCIKFPPSSTLRQHRKDIYHRRLKNGCIELKKKLSSVDEAKYSIPSCYGGNEELRLTLSRSEFERLVKQRFDHALDIVKLALDDSGISKTNIDEVVLVGGTTKIPYIREMLKSHFGANKIKTDIHPDEAVAAGASIQASFLKCGLPELENYKVTEVTPLSLGVAVSGKLMCVIIPKHTPLPCKITKTVKTSKNDQSEGSIIIFEGERKNIDFNNKLADFTITGCPKKRAGDVTIDINFELDDDGILRVTAKETSTGKCGDLSVTMGQLRLSEKKLKRSMEDMRRNKYLDDTFEDFVNFKNEVEEICQHVLYDLHKISSSKDRKIVEQYCNDLTKFSESLDFTDKDRLEARFAVFKKSVDHILRENRMFEISFH